MRAFLRETIRFASVSKIEGLLVIGKSDGTNFSAVDEAKELVFFGNPLTPIPEFEGTFGIPNLKVLENLLSFDAFGDNIEVTRVTRKQRDREGQEVEAEAPQKITFKGGRRNEATFWLSHGRTLPSGAEAQHISMDMEITPDKEQIAGLIKLAMTFATPECRTFGLKTINGDLYCTVGTEGSTTHFAEMVFMEGVKGNLRGNLQWDTGRFSALMKLVSGRDFNIGISNRGMMHVTFRTEQGSYQFYLLCAKGGE